MSKDPKIMALLTGAVALWLIYSMATATEAPSTALWTLQVVLIVGALIGFAGAVKQIVSGK